MTRCALLVRPRCYDGFHVLCNFGVLRLPANDITLDREQLRKDDQHVLEHHQFHVSVSNFLSLFFLFFSFFLYTRKNSLRSILPSHVTFPNFLDETETRLISARRVSCKYAYTRVGTRAKRVSKRCSPGNRFLAASWLLSNDPPLPAELLSRRGRDIVSAKITGARLSLHGCARFNTLAKWTESRGSFRRRPNRRR